MRIIKADRTAAIALIITAAAWIICLWTVLYPFLPESITKSIPLTGGNAPASIRSALVLTLLSALMAIFRVASILSIFSNGVEITGTIKILKMRNSRGYVIYLYSYEGKEYSNNASLTFTKKLKTLFREGGPISLVVSRNKPGQVLIKDIYMP